MEQREINPFENMEGQAIKVKEHLEKHGSITSWEAIDGYRITRLSACIFRLRRKGMCILTERRQKDDGTWYGVYHLMKEAK